MSTVLMTVSYEEFELSGLTYHYKVLNLDAGKAEFRIAACIDDETYNYIEIFRTRNGRSTRTQMTKVFYSYEQISKHYKLLREHMDIIKEEFPNFQ